MLVPLRSSGRAGAEGCQILCQPLRQRTMDWMAQQKRSQEARMPLQCSSAMTPGRANCEAAQGAGGA